MELAVPGYQTIHVRHLVLDYNGTLACDGDILPDVRECLTSLAKAIQIHVITADTFGSAAFRLKGLPVKLSVLPAESQAVAKLEYVKVLGREHTVCIGNGRNDRLMLKEAILGIAVILEEGAAVETLGSADVVCTSIASALGLLLKPLRLVATLRS